MNNGSNALSIYYSWKYTTKNNTYDIVRNIRIIFLENEIRK